MVIRSSPAHNYSGHLTCGTRPVTAVRASAANVYSAVGEVDQHPSRRAGHWSGGCNGEGEGSLPVCIRQTQVEGPDEWA